MDFDIDNYHKEETSHVHRFIGYTKHAEHAEDRYNHSFAGTTGDAVPEDESHVHKILTRTDYTDHLHEIRIKTGTAIYLGNGTHVHLATGITSNVKNHAHNFISETLTGIQL